MVTQCCICKNKYKDISGKWRVFLPLDPRLEVSHGFCPECVKKNYPGVKLNVKKL